MTSWQPSLRGVLWVLAAAQAPMPAQDRVGRDNRRQLGQKAAADTLALRGETPALFIREPHHSGC